MDKIIAVTSKVVPIMQGGTIFIDVSRQNDPEEILGFFGESEKEIKTGKDEKSKQDSSEYPEVQTRRVRCPECACFTAENEEKMLRHIRRVHRGENPFQCSICDYSTYNKCMFEEHVRIHQGIKPFKCSLCPYKSASKKNTKKHELIHRPDNPLKCAKCGFIARHTRSYQCHLKYHNTEDVLPKVKCYYCDGFFSKSGLELHYKSGIKCVHCSYVACSKSILSKHMSDHGNVKRKPLRSTFTCGLCQWSSKIKPRILLHLIHHPQEVDDSIDTSVLRRFGIIK